MDLNVRYQQLCTELGHLDSEIGMREERREVLRAEMKALKRLAKEVANAAPPAVDAAPDRSAP